MTEQIIQKCPQCQQEFKESRYKYVLMDLEESAANVKDTFVKNCYAMARDESSDKDKITVYAREFIESYPILERFEVCNMCHHNIKAVAKLEGGFIVSRWIWWAGSKVNKPAAKPQEKVQGVFDDVAF